MPGSLLKMAKGAQTCSNTRTLKQTKNNLMTAVFLPLWIGAPQIILIAVLLLLLFGGKKIPELMRGLGSGIKEFKDASKEDDIVEPTGENNKKL